MAVVDRVARIAFPLYWVVLFVLTHLPRAHIPGAPSFGDKIAHALAYGGLAFLAWQFQRVRRPIGPRFAPIAGAIFLAYGVVDELTQSLVGRGTELLDWVADAVGVVTVLGVLELRRRRASPPVTTDTGGRRRSSAT